MEWKKHIESKRGIAGGKPVIKGTRLAVGFLLELMAEGWTEEMILENYPSLDQDDIRAIYAYAAECTENEIVHQINHSA
jgi:uncharacterized protein (DUF433 family)